VKGEGAMVERVSGAAVRAMERHSGRCEVLNTENFRLVHDMRADEAEGMGKILEFAYKQFEAFCGVHGFELQGRDRLLEWMCFRREESFADYALATEKADLSWLSGYYSSRTNRVAVVRPFGMRGWNGVRQAVNVAGRAKDGVDDGLVKIVHEAGHQLAFNLGLQRRGVMYPFWATEGIALLFEDCVSDYLRKGRYSDGRRQRLLDLHREGGLIDLDEFLSMARLPAGVREADVYAQAWGFFLFLCENRVENLREYFTRLYCMRPGARSPEGLRLEFEECFGPVEELEEAWVFFLELSAAGKPFFASRAERQVP